jgi:hypothetical protein
MERESDELEKETHQDVCLAFGLGHYRDVISWHEFDMILQSSGVHLSGSEVRLLGKFFDSTGDHGVPYLDFVAWLDVLMDLKTLTKTFPTGNVFTGAHAKKVTVCALTICALTICALTIGQSAH